MKQKITSLVMALIMIASLFIPISVNAENNGTITISNVQATAGSTIAVPVKISNNPGILGATLKVTFDKGLTLLEGINGTAFADHDMTPPGKLISGCNFVWDKTELADEDIADGVLLTLKFKTPADAQPGAKYNVSVSYDDGSVLNKDEQSISPDIINGSIEIMSLMYGDLNFDSNINATDLVLMRRHIAGGYDQAINEISADVNDDGIVTIRDIIMMRRYIVGGYDVTFPSTGGTAPEEPAPEEPVDPNRVEFAAKDLAYVQAMFPPYTIDVKKENSNKTTTYKLEDGVQVYVNGELSTDGLADPALSAANVRGTVTLVDSPDAGSTETDGKYDYVMVDEYIVAQVADVRVMNDEVTIVTDTASVRINWSLVDKDTPSVVFYKDGAEISYEDVKEDDVILVKSDSTGDWYEIFVSDKTVTGTAEEKSTVAGKEYLMVDGTKYEFDCPPDIAAMELNTEYILYLDAMGYVYTWELGTSNKNIGIVIGMYTKAGEETPTVRMINTDGEIVTYETKNHYVATAIATAVGQSTTSFSKAYITDISACVIEYTISGGKIVLKNAVAPVNASDVVAYKASTSKLGGYTIDATATKILDLDAFLNNDGDVTIFDATNFEDEGDYKAWIYDRNAKTGVHGFVILTSGTTSLKPTGSLAVVTASGPLRDVDGVLCQKLTVARNGEEDITVLTDALSYIPEGTVIMYTVGPEGYVEAWNLNKIFTPATSYSAMMTGILANTNFTAAAANAYIIDDDSDGIYSLTVHGNTDADVEIYYGPVYSASDSVLEIFNYQYAGTSSINDTEAFTLADANVYTYNYDAIAGEGMSVTVGGKVQKNTIYKNMFGADATMTNVDWSTMAAAMVDPMTALVRVVDGDVTDVFYFVAE